MSHKLDQIFIAFIALQLAFGVISGLLWFFNKQSKPIRGIFISTCLGLLLCLGGYLGLPWGF